jgi:hypothetical protein
MNEREWRSTKFVRRWLVREFGLRTWDMLSAEQADTAVRIAALHGIDVADRYLAPINTQNWSIITRGRTTPVSLDQTLAAPTT